MVNELWLTAKIEWLTKTVKALVTGVTQTEYTISVTSPANGTIGPGGEIKVPEGISKTFTIEADGGYTISDVLVDGVSVGVVESYTFENVIDNHTITAIIDVDTENPLPVELGGTGATTADDAFWALANAAIGPQYEGDDKYSPLPVELGGTGVTNPNDFFSYLGSSIMISHSADFMNQILSGVMARNSAAFVTAFEGVMHTSFATSFPAFAGFLQRDPGQTMTVIHDLFLNSGLTYSGCVTMKEVISTDYDGFGDQFGDIFQGWYSKFAHASRHGSGGTDPITPAAIGAATADHTHSGYLEASFDSETGYLTVGGKTYNLSTLEVV